jgi:hypothetical protein
VTILRDLFGPGAWGTGGNLVAAAILSALGVLFRRPLARAITRARAHIRADETAAQRELRDTAAAAHRIIADLHKHVTGREHPDAPGGDQP